MTITCIGTIDDDVLVQLVDSVNAMIEGTLCCCMFVCMYACVVSINPKSNEAYSKYVHLQYSSNALLHMYCLTHRYNS